MLGCILIAVAGVLLVATGILLCYLDYEMGAVGCIVVGAIAAVTALMIGIAMNTEAKLETAKWQDYAITAREVAVATDSFVAIKTIDEYNQWLAEAKASQKECGIFSFYRTIDLSGFDYIVPTGVRHEYIE